MTLSEIIDAFTGLFAGRLSSLDLVALVFGAIFVGVWLVDGRSIVAKACFATSVTSMVIEANLNDSNAAGANVVLFILTMLMVQSWYSVIILTVASVQARRNAAGIADSQSNKQRAGDIDVV